MLFRLPMSPNRTYLMYQDIMAADELDSVDENLERVGFPVPRRAEGCERRRLPPKGGSHKSHQESR
jgi:hypothetical protein